jgi:RHS repeat-associated protein
VSYSYQPDALGVTRAADPEEVWALTDNNQAGIVSVSFDYDAIGNEVMKCLGTIVYGTDPSTDVCSGEAWTYVYDGKDQLRRATHLATGASVLGSEEYWYDEDGARMAVVKRDGSGNTTEGIVWDGPTEAHFGPTGAATHTESYVNEGTPLVRMDRFANTGTAVTMEYQFHGMAGSTLAAIDPNGVVNASFSYSPFGEIIESVDGGGNEGVAAHPRRWNDKYVDDVSGLAYYGARYYDKTTFTWTQDDPLYRFVPDLAQSSTPRRASLYTFSLNNPLRYLDPDGRDVWTRGATNWSKGRMGSPHYANLQEAWRKEMLGPNYGGGEPHSRNNNVTTTSFHEAVPIYAVVFEPAGETGIPIIDLAEEIIEDPEDFVAAGEEIGGKIGEAAEAVRGAAKDVASLAVDEAGAVLDAMGNAIAGDGPTGEEVWQAFTNAAPQGVPNGIGATGQVGEQYLEQLGGVPQQYLDTDYGARFVDQLVNGMANESKVGYQTLTDSNRMQIFKDVWLMANDPRVDNVTWHFFLSPVTGQGGPSQQLQDQLLFHGIGIQYHW